MLPKARRKPGTSWPTSARRALLTLCLCLAGTAPSFAQEIIAAHYEAPTDRYAHGILGDAIEWGALVVETDEGKRFRLDLPQSRVFEDTAPRLIDIPGEAPAVMVVETEASQGARLALYRETGLLAATPFIGRTNRWLAPIGAADLDGDGALEIAYVDRPHLAKTIRIWRYENGRLNHMADLPGFTNHRIGETDIAGGIRDCGNGPEMLVADRNWDDVYSLRWTATGFEATKIGKHQGRQSFAAAMDCQ